MKKLSTLTDRDIDRLLDGRVPENADDLDDLAGHLGGLKRAQAHVREDVADRQIAQIVQTSKRFSEAGRSAPAASSSRRSRSGRSVRKRAALLTAKIGAVFVGASMLTAGLAFAGVTLPQAVNDALGNAGVTLPNQATDALENAQGQPEDLGPPQDLGRPEATGSETSTAVLDVIQGWSGDFSCWFGQAVAAAATGNELDLEDSPCANTENGVTAAQGGKATGADKSGGRSAAGSDNASTTGQGAATTKSGGAPGDSSGAGAQGGQGTGAEASEKGQSNPREDEAPRTSGGQPEDED